MKIMKLFRYIFLVSSLVLFWNGYAQRAVVTANSYDISDNLDLQAVASIFGDSKDLADFEYRLNDPDLRISNLDLNGDGYVDYLRVVETIEGNTHLIVVQAVLGQDMFQDVATIEVEKQNKSKVYVQVVGNPYLYGASYIYEPVYVSTPPVFSLFWGNSYSPYYSSWYWGYYPSYYSYYRPYPTATYIVNVHTHINYNNRYVYTNNRYSTRTPYMYENVRQNYYERKNPNNSFTSRNTNYNNRYDLASNRRTTYSRSEYSVNSNARNNRYGTNNSRTVNKVSAEGIGNRSSSRSSYQTGTAVSSDRKISVENNNSRAVNTTQRTSNTSRAAVNSPKTSTSTSNNYTRASRSSYSTNNSSSFSNNRSSNNTMRTSSSPSRSNYRSSASSGSRSSSAASYSSGRSSSNASSSRSSYSR
jgi:hypothetical protein